MKKVGEIWSVTRKSNSMGFTLFQYYCKESTSKVVSWYEIHLEGKMIWDNDRTPSLQEAYRAFDFYTTGQ